MHVRAKINFGSSLSMKKKLNSNLLFLVWFVSSLFSPSSLSVLPVCLVPFFFSPYLSWQYRGQVLSSVTPPPPPSTPPSNFKFQMHFTFFVFLFRVYFSPFHSLTLQSVFFSPLPLQLSHYYSLSSTVLTNPGSRKGCLPFSA